MRPIPVLAALLAAAATSAAAVEIQYGAAPKSMPRKVLIDPAVDVKFDRDFGAGGGGIGVPDKIRPDDARRLADEMGASFRTALAAALQAKGFQVTTAPGSDVMRLTPALRKVTVNAVDHANNVAYRQYVRDAGQAQMEVEGRDASGQRIFLASEQRVAGDHARLSQADNVTSRLWFEAMFRRYAEELAEKLARAG